MRCLGVTKNGSQCERNGQENGYCAKHQDQVTYDAATVDKYDIPVADLPEIAKPNDPAAAFLEYIRQVAPQVVEVVQAMMVQNAEMKEQLASAKKDYDDAMSAADGRRQEILDAATDEDVKEARRQAAENLKQAKVGLDTRQVKAQQDQEPKVTVTRFEKEFSVLKEGERHWASMIQMNGVTYLFISGEPTEVPQSVAQLLEDRDNDRKELEEKLAKVQGVHEYETLRAMLES